MHPAAEQLTAKASERVLVGAQCSRRPAGWIAARAVLSIPLQLRGEARAYVARAGGEDVRVVSIGRDGMLRLVDRLFEGVREVGPIGRRALWSPGRPELAPADLVVSEVPSLAAPRFRRAGWVVVPHWVRWQRRLSSLATARPGHSLADDLRKVRNRGYAIEHGRSRRDWEEFFAEMVAPLVTARFGADAWVPSPWLQRQFAARGDLVFVCKDGRRVAGICVVPTGGTAWVPAIGVKDGDRELVREGAMAAAYDAAIRVARAGGCDRLDLGRTSPFVNDGLHRYKRKWGFEPVRDPIVPLSAVWVERGSEAARRAFAREPVQVQSGDGLRVFAG